MPIRSRAGFFSWNNLGSHGMPAWNIHGEGVLENDCMNVWAAWKDGYEA